MSIRIIDVFKRRNGIYVIYSANGRRIKATFDCDDGSDEWEQQPKKKKKPTVCVDVRVWLDGEGWTYVLEDRPTEIPNFDVDDKWNELLAQLASLVIQITDGD